MTGASGTEDIAKPGLITTTAKGVGYLGLASIVVNIVRLLALAVLARELSAADFGIAAVSLAVVQIGQEIGAFGLETIVIQRQELTEDYLNCCFWSALLFAGVLWGAYWAISPLFAWTMKMPPLAPVTRVMSLVILITCLGMIPRSLLERQLAYGKVALLEAAGQIMAQTLAVALALAGLGVWALVYGFLVGESVKTLAFWLTARWRPRLRGVRLINPGALLFGSYVTADRILTYFSLNADRIIIGRLLGASAAGFYTLAYEMIAFPAKRFAALVGRVLFPMLSQIQDQAEATATYYLTTLRYVSLLTVPALVGLAVVAPEVASLIFGPKAADVAPLIRLLCPAGIVFAILTPVGALLYSKGRPDLSLLYSCLTLVVVSLLVAMGAEWGLYWAGTSVGLAWIVLFPVMMAMVSRVAGLPLFKPYLALVNAAGAAVCTGVPALLVKMLFSYSLVEGIFWSLGAQMAAGTIGCLTFLWIREREALLFISSTSWGKINGMWARFATSFGKI